MVLLLAYKRTSWAIRHRVLGELPARRNHNVSAR